MARLNKASPMAKTLEELDNEARTTVRPYWWLYAESFDALVKRIDEMFPNAVTGRPVAISDVGEPYLEFFASSMSRPDTFDMKVAERHVAAIMGGILRAYFSSTAGNIYWRIRPEEDWSDAPQIIMYDENGPDIDVYTD